MMNNIIYSVCFVTIQQKYSEPIKPVNKIINFEIGNDETMFTWIPLHV